MCTPLRLDIRPAFVPMEDRSAGRRHGPPDLDDRDPLMESRRERILTEGMRLFGEQGYAATSIAQIEAAAGLAPGSGSLYKHFRSKRQVLEAGLEKLLRTDGPPVPELAPGPPDTTTADLDTAARAGLARMDHDRDLNRLLFRGLDAFPDLLQRFGTDEIGRIEKDTASLLAELAGDTGDADTDWDAVATVLQGATAHYWLLEDLFGEHPAGVSRERFVKAIATFATMAVRSAG
ncbi:helix-turn-helix domain-containing protein [Gordonia sp. CPCC 206044]|uniref:TetR/AcrR family transcriptional regulator n=1 Tax=Gordonia sp. CPCC 206044 TaxID=3140793 RepID=UPI003AF3EE94